MCAADHLVAGEPATAVATATHADAGSEAVSVLWCSSRADHTRSPQRPERAGGKVQARAARLQHDFNRKSYCHIPSYSIQFLLPFNPSSWLFLLEKKRMSLADANRFCVTLVRRPTEPRSNAAEEMMARWGSSGRHIQFLTSWGCVNFHFTSFQITLKSLCYFMTGSGGIP